jgi:hypothetical protein
LTPPVTLEWADDLHPAGFVLRKTKNTPANTKLSDLRHLIRPRPAKFCRLQFICAAHPHRLAGGRPLLPFNLAIGFYYKSRAVKNVNEFSLSGRNVPWWLAGTSMVATTFAADTPLAVTGMVAMGGIAGNWLWWNFIASGMLTVCFYAPYGSALSAPLLSPRPAKEARDHLR